jgi:quercetin dioxygenase-like cupin family protein
LPLPEGDTSNRIAPIRDILTLPRRGKLAPGTGTKERQMPSADKAFAVDSTKLERAEVWGETDQAVHWKGAFAVYGGHGATASSVIVYEIEPGKRLGWHTDATEETQYIIAGTGKLYLEDGSTVPIGPGSVFVLPTPMRHDVENTGKQTLRAVAFFAAAMFTQDFDQVMMPPKSHILGTPNREG